MTIDIPARTRSAVGQYFGVAGEDWLTQVDAVLSDIASRWKLSIGDPFEDGWPTNLVYRVMSGETEMVLKTGYPQPELYTELAVLKRWRGLTGRVQLVDYDKDIPCMLLERINPGLTFRASGQRLKDVDVRGLIRDMPTVIEDDHEFPTYLNWVDRAFTAFQRQHQVDHWLAGHIEWVWQRVLQLYDEHEPSFLLHGDLHHENMLLDGEVELVAIDPKGVIGPRLFEYGRFMHNFLFDSDVPPEAQIQERSAVFAGEFEHWQIIEMGYIDLTLAMTWTVNDGTSVDADKQSLLGIFRDLAERSRAD